MRRGWTYRLVAVAGVAAATFMAAAPAAASDAAAAQAESCRTFRAVAYETTASGQICWSSTYAEIVGTVTTTGSGHSGSASYCVSSQSNVCSSQRVLEYARSGERNSFVAYTSRASNEGVFVKACIVRASGQYACSGWR
jgi:hypothetical protein